MIQLGARLFAAASLVRGGGIVADVGTDHAFLPVFLIQNGICKNVIASDIGEGPLANAQKTVDEYGLSDRIELRLYNGLNQYRPGETDEIVLCGMGGNLIEEILTAAPWVKRQNVHLVLQPMTHAEDVRRYLCENGFVIDEERCVKDGARVYLLISATWQNAKNTHGPGYYYFGKTLNQSGESTVITKKQYLRVLARYLALQKAERNEAEQALLADVLSYYNREKTK